MTKRRKGGSGREGLIMGEDRLLQETREQKLEHRDRRPDALGELGVLSDELICAILDRLTPRDLGRLSCVSSFMYTFCNEEPLWMSMCLRNPGLLEYRSSWKKTTLHQQNFLTAAVEPSENPLKFDGFYSLFLYRRWYRCFTTLDAFYKDDGYLERRETSGGDFCLDYSKPVLLTDLAKTWPARKTWTIDQFFQKYGETTFRISQRSSRKITMKLKDYVSYISCQHDEDPLYIFDEKFGESAPSLLEDYTVPIIFREDFFDVLDEEQRPPFRWLIIGPERSGASWHVDPALTSAWNTLLVGRKRWALYPPGKVPAGVTVHVNEEDGDVDIETPSSLQWWLDVYPFLAEKDKPIECTQLPGETIFVPSGWWHCVLNLETTIAITQNFVNESNFDFVCIDFCPGHLHKGVARAGWLAIDNQDVARSSTSEDDGELGNHNGFQKFDFSYDTDFLSKFVSEEADHYTFTWGEGSCVGQREFREWLHRLWVVRPELRTLVWKGACLALKADAWLGRIMEICASNNLPLPSEDEKLPVGTGSNPVYLVSDHVIKLYVEGGLMSSLYSLGTELEFYNLLHKVQSQLLEHVPDVISSGILIQAQDGSYKNCSWAGGRMPDLIKNPSLIDVHCIDSGKPFGVWGKMEFYMRNNAAISSTKIWPYLITKRLRGDIFANLRERLLPEDNINLASFLGDQLHNLHHLPLPTFACDLKDNDNDVSSKVYETFERCFINENIAEEQIVVAQEWKPFIASMGRRMKDIVSRLVQWGDPIPKILVDKVGEYIPVDPSQLIGLFKEEDGVYTCPSPSWIHSDVMDDNIYMQKNNYAVSDDESMDGDARTNPNMQGTKERWFPAHIIDFSDLLIGDPLFDLIPIHIDVFRADSTLLKRFLESYRSPIGLKAPSHGAENPKKFERASYRAMCYCILHEDNVLGTIFGLRKDLRSATAWEEVEEALWGELNNMHHSPIM